MGKMNKLDKWVPNHLNEHQVENRNVNSDMLLQCHKRNLFLHRTFTSYENWTYFKNPKRKKIVTCTWRSRCFNTEAKVLRQEDHVLWDQRGICRLWTIEPEKNTLKSHRWDILPKQLYSSILVPSNYPFFASVGHAFPLTEQYFNNF